MKSDSTSHDGAPTYINPRTSKFVNKEDALEAERLLDNAMLMAQLVDWIFTQKWTHPDLFPS